MSIGNIENRKVPCQVWSRVVGYLRPVDGWNVAKKKEFEDREVYNTPTVKDLETKHARIQSP